MSAATVIAVTCSVCRRRFEGTPVELRGTIWPHAESDHPGRTVKFRDDPVVLSCNCGECEFCTKRIAR